MNRELLNELSDQALESILCAAIDQLQFEANSGDLETSRRAKGLLVTCNDLLGENECPSGHWTYLATAVSQTVEQQAEVIKEILACCTSNHMEVQRALRDQSDDWTTVIECPDNFADYIYRVR